MPHVISQTNPSSAELRFLYLPINKAMAAKSASNAKEPAELLVVKKPLISFEYRRCSNWKCSKLFEVIRCCARAASDFYTGKPIYKSLATKAPYKPQDKRKYQYCRYVYTVKVVTDIPGESGRLHRRTFGKCCAKSNYTKA